MVGADIAGEHREAGQVSLKAGGAGATIGLDDGLDTHIEDVHSRLEHAHVGIDADQRHRLNCQFTEQIAQRRWNTGCPILGEDVVFGQEAIHRRYDVRIGRLLDTGPAEHLRVGSIRLVDKAGEEKPIERVALDQARDRAWNVACEIVHEAVLQIDDEQGAFHATSIRVLPRWNRAITTVDRLGERLRIEAKFPDVIGGADHSDADVDFAVAVLPGGQRQVNRRVFVEEW